MEENKYYVVLVSSKIASPSQTLRPRIVWVGSHLRWLQIGLRPWIAEAAANLPQQRRQQHWQLRHRLLRWRWQCGSGSGGLHPNGRGSRARPGRGRRCAQASPSRLALRPRGLHYAASAHRQQWRSSQWHSGAVAVAAAAAAQRQHRRRCGSSGSIGAAGSGQRQQRSGSGAWRRQQR